MATDMVQEIKWLKSQKVKDKLQGALQARCCLLENLLIASESEMRLPHTVALFGSWGCGKTALLAEFNDLLTRKNRIVIYFNAYKHAAFMEVMPALVYRLIEAAPTEEQDAKDYALSIACNLVAQNSENLGKWVQQRIGVNPHEIYQTLDQGLKQWQKAQAGTPGALSAEQSRKLLSQYYMQVDKAQNALETCYASYMKDKPDEAIIVLVDELDRCDPGEAFDVMKQLRVLFSMRNLPFFFVLAANPEPIGQAIQHKYGLDPDDYESRRILEKFVDTCLELTDAVKLRYFIETKWTEHIPDRKLQNCSTMIGLDSLVNHSAAPKHPFGGRILHTLLNELDNAHFLYSNLRLLEKSMVLARSYLEFSPEIWVIWHLILVKQIRPQFRKEIARITNSLKLAAETGYIQAIRRFAANGLIGPQGELQASNEEGFSIDRPSTPFRAYYDSFWETMKQERINLSENPRETERAAIIGGIINDIPKMEFLANLCAFSLGDFDQLRVGNPDGQELKDVFSKGYDEQRLRHFGWMLANF